MPEQTKTWKDHFRELAVFGGIGGGFGGLLSWLYTLALGKSFAVAPAFAFFIYIVLGIGAALFGLFLLAHTDTRAVKRAFVFAVVCGFAWRPVFDASAALVQKEAAELKVRNLTDTVKESSTRLLNNPTPTVDTIETTSKDAVALLNASSKIRNDELRKSATGEAQLAVEALRKKGNNQPGYSSALLRIAKVAADTDSTEVTAKSLEALIDQPAALAATGDTAARTLDAILVAPSTDKNDRVKAYAEHAKAISIMKTGGLGTVDPKALREARTRLLTAKERYNSLSDTARAKRADNLIAKVDEMLSP